MAPRGWARVVGEAALAAAVFALGVLALGGPGTRLGWWDFRTGLGLLPWAAYAGLLALALGIVALLLPGARSRGALAVVMGLVAFGVPWNFRRQAVSVPPIHDITTDTEDPPVFVALAERPGATNTVEYGGAELAAQQKQAYPDLVPIVLADPPARALARAEEAARSLGWRVASTDPESGRMEATDTTWWYGFKDDVVVRVRPQGTGSRLDVRSVSRVGRSDLGANARRIRRFRDALGP